MKSGLIAAAAVLVLAAATESLAGPPRVIYSTIQTSPTSNAPGLAGVQFDNDNTGFSRPYGSLNGRYWILEAQLNTATVNDDECIVLGSELGGVVVVREGDVAPWEVDPNVLIGPIREKMQVNNMGHFAFGQNLAGTAPAAADEQIVAFLASFVDVATEGDLVGATGEVYGATIHSASIANSGIVGLVANTTVGALPTTQDDFVRFGGATVSQSGIAGTPAGQAFNETWNLFDTDETYVSADGTRVFSRGTLTGATTSNVVLTVNDVVVLQESVVYAPLTAGVTTVSDQILTSAGDWFANGETTGDADNWVIRNGVVVAQRSDLVPGGLAGETFSEALFDAVFFSAAGNALGDYVYGGTTSNADPEFDAVVVLNDSEVVLRQGDPVDLNGNGLADDDAFIDIFNNYDMVLDNNLYLYFTADVRDGLSATIGQAFIRAELPICKGDMNCDGAINFGDIDPFVAALSTPYYEWPFNCYHRAGDVNGDGVVNFGDIDPFVAALSGPGCP